MHQPGAAGASGEVKENPNIVALGGAADEKAAGAAGCEVELGHGGGRMAQFCETSAMRKARRRAMTS